MFSYETQGTNTYLVYEISDYGNVDTLSMGMIINNKISGLAPAFYTQSDDRKLMKYNVTAKIPCSQFFAETVGRKQMLGVFKSVLEAIKSADEYMIEINSLLLDLEYIFVDVSTCKAEVICLPVISEETTDIVSFFKNIVFSTQYDQSENCDYVAQIISYLNRKSGFVIDEFYELVSRLDGSAAPKPAVKTAPAATNTVNNMQQAQPVIAQQRPVSANPIPQPQNVIPTPAPQPIPQPAPQQMNVPPVQQPKPQTPANNQNAAVAPVDDKDKMSMAYLLMHYSKENAAKYKEQKAAKAANQAAQPAAPNAKNNAYQNSSFAIPGAPQPSVSQSIPVPQPSSQPKPQPSAAMPVNNNNMSAIPTGGASSFMPQQTMNPAPMQQTPQAQPMPMGTTVLNSKPVVQDTTILSEYNNAAASLPYLIRTKNKERIDLNKEVIRIGKEKSFVDYFIGDNSAISRSHANIVTKNGKVYIVDTNSTNHTYVNESIIQSNVEVELKNGDSIKLANEYFEFFE